MDQLQDFMISRVRVQILELLFTQPNEMFFVREITRQTHEEINAVRRELERMLASGLVKSEERGNRLYYYLNKNYLYFPENIINLTVPSFLRSLNNFWPRPVLFATIRSNSGK